MTWIKFIIWLLGGYAVYYAVLIIWDQLHRRRVSGDDTTNELTFIEHIQPAAAMPDVAAPLPPSPIVASGGVSLKDTFNLAREEVVEYIRAVSF